jgi:hypothetical protein
MKRGRGYAAAAILAVTAVILLPSAAPFHHNYPIATRGCFGGCHGRGSLFGPFHKSRGATSTAANINTVGAASSMASFTAAPAASSSLSPMAAAVDDPEVQRRKQERKELIRKEGGRFAFDTKYGALNPFAIYYGLTSILLGIPWFMVLTLYQLFQVVTFSRLDKHRRIPIFFTHCWGVALMKLTRCYPKIENMEVLKQFYKR